MDATNGRAWTRPRKILLLALLLGHFLNTHAQSISRSPSQPWINEKRQAQFDRSLEATQAGAYTTDPTHAYTLPELINLAELHNPDTRVAWQNAKIKLEEVGYRRVRPVPLRCGGRYHLNLAQWTFDWDGVSPANHRALPAYAESQLFDL
jgi:hypothetical protein